MNKMNDKYIIQYVECNFPNADYDDWPDCSLECSHYHIDCPVRQQINNDIKTNEFAKINRYTVWPE